MRPATVDCVRLGDESLAQRRRRRLSQYRQPFRGDIAALTSQWRAGEDLADSFPGLLFALACGYGLPSQRQIARHMIDTGEPLRDIAAALGLPFWLRRIPASCFTQALPPLPLDPAFTEALLNRIPDEPAVCTEWLDRLLISLRLAGRDFALWAAKEVRFLPIVTPEIELQWLLGWVWASRNPDTPGHALIRSAWHPTMSWKRAHEEMAIWRRRVDLIGALAGEPRDPWFRNGHALGFEFVHLDSVAAFIAESTAMENCLDQYATHLAYGRVRIFSVRRAGRPVADVELTLRTDEATMPSIAQVRGQRNRRAPPAVWQAVHAWLGAQAFRPLEAHPTPAMASRDALRAFWTPYVTALEQAGLAERLTGELITRGRRRATLRRPAGGMVQTLRDVLTATAQARLAQRG